MRNTNLMRLFLGIGFMTILLSHYSSPNLSAQGIKHINVLFLYTPKARDHVGGENRPESETGFFASQEPTSLSVIVESIFASSQRAYSESAIQNRISPIRTGS